MTGARELVQLRVEPAAPQHVRLSVLGGHTQLDVSLPLDATIASLLPELVRLVQSRDGVPVAPPDEAPSAKDAKRNYWVLATAAHGEPLAPDTTLREAGVVNGSLLRLSSERALTIPTLYDDVVDAAARLNKASYTGWDATAARWMAYAGIHLAALTLLFFLVGDAFSRHRGALAGLSIVVALALVGVGAMAHRSYREPSAGAALGWAAIPISAGVVWALLSGLGGYGPAAGCAVLVLVCYCCYRAIGTGRWAYLAAGTFFTLGGLALVLHQVGVRADLVGAGLAVVGVLACLTVPWLTAPMGRFTPPRHRDEPEPEPPMFENPFSQPSVPAATDEPASSTPTAEGVWDRVRSAQLTRAALYTGFGVAATVGGSVVLSAQKPPHWSGLVFALMCVAALALYTRRPTTAVERASLVVPAVALCGYACWAAQDGAQPLPLVAFSVVLLAAVGAAVVGMRVSDGGPSGRTRTALAYVDYLATAALVPIALWVAGVYSRLGF
ncbi:hypothetical protein EB75_19615 [Mycobacterium sp. ST-F2]|uniref:type VII secretion integral membrane protein EccD n=1 Tax=Mycobacterium sp. ST-F2 TaxID=1490484 RepID=UPI00093891AB|nr:type VII secretion integral membrane protein EccD [Mycobacterium sp. ST-F2]OKH85580.1 hypothetical protein EB75_19615 [Mycobacterium sp. ST-F2]